MSSLDNKMHCRLKGNDRIIQYSQATAININIGFTQWSILLSKRGQRALKPDVYANEFWCVT